VDVRATVEQARGGDLGSVARLLTAIERSVEEAADTIELVRDLPQTGHVLGVFGPPGAGKSSLIASLLPRAAAQGRVAVLATDPSSPFTGGALLGDRLRMLKAIGQTGVYVRSFASRDPLRTLSHTAAAASQLLTRLGFEWIIVEAVGAGQADLGTRLVADTNLLVLSPGLGDDVQAMKAGVMEVADLIVLNKSDLPGAKLAVGFLRQAVSATTVPGRWKAPVLAASSVEGTGFEAVLEQVRKHRAFLRGEEAAREAVVEEALLELALAEVTTRLRRTLPGTSEFRRLADSVHGDRTLLLGAVSRLTKHLLEGSAGAGRN
jgi:LAO/AO transport system kinase